MWTYSKLKKTCFVLQNLMIKSHVIAWEEKYKELVSRIYNKLLQLHKKKINNSNYG